MSGVRRVPKDQSVTTEYVLRAMVRNYAKGHIWDHMDSTVCQMAAEEIAHLRKVIARKEQPVEVLDKDNLLMQMEAEDRRKIAEAAVRVSLFAKVQEIIGDAAAPEENKP